MIRAAALLLAATAALAPVAASAQTVTVTVDPARRALGFELAKLLNPEAPTMAALDRVFGTTLAEAMLADPAMKALEEQYPGILGAMTDAMKPVLLRYLRAELPKLWDEIGVVFASELTEVDLRAAIAFYRSPTGTRIIELMITEADFGPMLADMVENDYTTSATSLSRANLEVAGKAAEQLTSAQRDDVLRFMTTETGRKIARLYPRVMKAVSEWSEKPSPEIEAEIEAALKPVVEKFTGMKL